MRPTFKVEGLSGLAANFYGYNARVQAAMREAVREEYGVPVREGAQARARVDTGKMRDLIVDTYSEQGLVCTVGWNERDFTADGDYPYYFVHELGSSTVSPEPMIGPEHAEHAPKLTRRIGDIMRAEAVRK